MKKSIVIIAAGLVAVASAEERVGVATVTNVAASQDTRTDVLTVTYDLENTQNNESLFVTMDILTNGVSIGKNIFKSVSGDISPDSSTLVTPGTGKRIVWEAAKDWPDQFTTNASVKISAYYADKLDQLPGIYMKIDLEGTTPCPIVYTMAGPAVDANKRVVNDDDKGRYLWMRRVEACPQGFVMGADPHEATPNYYYYGERETKHTVKLMKPFFVGIFPVTRKQYRLIKGSDPTYVTSADTAPVNQITYYTVRGQTAADGTTVNWPNNTDNMHIVGANSFLDILRGKTNLEFDLPTEAQWEYMCRAGTDTAWNNGVGTVGNVGYEEDDNLAKLGWYKSNVPASAAQPVGQKLPNAWGIYDCHGNVWEWCLDWFASDITAMTVDPVGPTSGSNNVLRGGAHDSVSHNCRAARRDTNSRTTQGNTIGFRLVVPLER